jgi:aminomethyltransferase
MLHTPLYEKLTASGARIGEYCGVETAARFTSPESEYESLQSGCGLYDLGWQARIVVTGEDRQRWLNGMVTNNVRDLGVNHGLYCFLLTAQGRIQSDMYVYNRGDRILIDTDGSQAEKLKEIFERFIIMDDVEVSAPELKIAVGVAGPRADVVLRAAGLDDCGLPELEIKILESADSKVELVRKGARTQAMHEISAPVTVISTLWDQLREKEATPVGFEALELWRIAGGTPRYGQDIRERDLPQETEQMQALHFSKGCYVGQEIVERIRSRGQVHRRFAGFALENREAEIAPGAKVQREGKDVGEITSVALLPTTNGAGPKKVALGYIRREAGAPGVEVTVNGAKARVSNLPFE